MIKTGIISNIIVLSLLFSILSLTSKIISDDSSTLAGNHAAKYVEFSINCTRKSRNQQKQKKNNKYWISINHIYVIRALFRVLDVLFRLSVFSLLWAVWGGFYLFGMLCIELIVAAIV